jgi:hypothetical protein
LSGGIACRTTSRGGSNQLGDRSNSIGDSNKNPRFYGVSNDNQDELSP